MISLAGRDILHAWGKFVFTGLGLGLLIGVTLSMAGIYRGMVDDAEILLDNSGADLWVVQRDTLGPYAESSSLQDDLYRGILTLPGVVAGRQRHLSHHAGRSGRSGAAGHGGGRGPGRPRASRVSPASWSPVAISPRGITRRWPTSPPAFVSASKSVSAAISIASWD
jgi:putative ABC transport system permease protein